MILCKTVIGKTACILITCAIAACASDANITNVFSVTNSERINKFVKFMSTIGIGKNIKSVEQRLGVRLIKDLTVLRYFPYIVTFQRLYLEDLGGSTLYFYGKFSGIDEDNYNQGAFVSIEFDTSKLCIDFDDVRQYQRSYWDFPLNTRRALIHLEQRVVDEISYDISSTVYRQSEGRCVSQVKVDFNRR